jgi:hypothetical protein
MEKLAYNIKSILERRKNMKKILVVLLAVITVSGFMAVPAFAADKLVVMDATGTIEEFAVTDTGDINANGKIILGRGFTPTPLSAASRIEISSNAFTEFYVTSHNTTGNPSLVLYKSRGDMTTPTIVGDGDFTGSFFARGFDGSAYRNVGGVRFAVDGSPAAGSVPGRVTFHTTAPGAGSFTERMRIASSGYVGIGTTTPAYLLDVNGQARINGVVYGSSRTIKDNIVDLKSSEALETLKGLNPVKYHYKADQSEERMGFIAEDVPDLVAKNGRTGIDPMDIVAVLTKVVQEQEETAKKQQAVINTLTEKLSQLEAKMEGLQTREIPLSILSQK